MYITAHCRTNPTEFGECRVNRFFTGVQKRILTHYNQWSKIIRSMLVSKHGFQLNWNSVYALQITILHAILISVYIQIQFSLQDTQNVMHYGLQTENIQSAFYYLLCVLYFYAFHLMSFAILKAQINRTKMKILRKYSKVQMRIQSY